MRTRFVSLTVAYDGHVWLGLGKWFTLGVYRWGFYLYVGPEHNFFALTVNDRDSRRLLTVEMVRL